MWWLAVDYQIWIVPACLALLLVFFLPRRQRNPGWRERIAHRLFLVVLRSICLFAIVALLFTAFAAGVSQQTVSPHVRKNSVTRSRQASDFGTQRETSTLKVLTLNLAHGRANGFHQAMQSKEAIRQNLRRIAAMLEREKPIIVALQEADGPSLWSGGFDHVSYLAEKASFDSFARAEHVRAWRMSYGTAMLSQAEILLAESFTFDPMPPLMPKGFLTTRIAWPGKPDLQVDVVSVHLDFSLSANRRRQVRRMIAELDPRGRPLIVMGDFNCDFMARRSALSELAEALDLQAYEQDSTQMATFALTRKRIDWILISRDLAFVSHQTLPDELSDHFAVTAELRLVTGTSQR